MPFPFIPVAMGLASLASQWFGARKQAKENKELASFQADANQRYLEQQLEYNSPKNQMSRWQEAGLNPNLVYSQGNPGNQSAPLQYPDIKPSDYQRLGEALPLINQSMLANSQVQAQNMRTIKDGVQTQLMKLQADVLEKNPLLDEAAYRAMINGLIATAQSKMAGAAVDTIKSEWFSGEKSFKINGVDMHGPAGVLKMETELKKLLQDFDLGTTDMKIKAEILNSKELRNRLDEIQVKWMSDGDITPQHVWQFIQLLLMKSL